MVALVRDQAEPLAALAALVAMVLIGMQPTVLVEAAAAGDYQAAEEPEELAAMVPPRKAMVSVGSGG